jgi:glycosidase
MAEHQAKDRELTNGQRAINVPKSIHHAWWKESTVYQVYPASFCDSNGDGLGDIPGITSKLDHIKNLGADIVWSSPVLDSPQVDMGYDICNYKDIYAPYGTMADHDALIKGLHDRGMKYVLDLVVNHTSNEHPWFKESRSSKDNKYRDWYIWRPARYSESGERVPPNNWESCFSGSAWEWDEHTQEYYLRLFAYAQPDLNWENPEVVAAVHDIVRFWLDRGVDGFRMDVINFISKEPGLPDAPVTKPGFLQSGIQWYSCGPRLHEFFQGLGAILKEYDAFSVGEMPGVYDPKEIAKAVSQDRGELGMAFHFEIMNLDNGTSSKYDTDQSFTVRSLKDIVNKWQNFMFENAGWNALYMENHDQGRSISRYASDSPELRVISSKMLATHLALQSGTVFIYQGQELAQINVPRDWPVEIYKDIECVNHWETVIRDCPDDKELHARTLKQYRLISRDNARTPVQWSAAPNAGFTDEGVTPWMPIHPDYKEWNAESVVKDPDSSYHYWAKILKLRKDHKDIFVYGSFKMVDMANEEVVAYLRTSEDGKGKALVVTSFSGKDIEWTIPEEEAKLFGGNAQIAASNYSSPVLARGKASLRPYEAFVLLSS